MNRVALDLDGRFAFFPEFLRFAAEVGDGFNASLLREIADQIEKQQAPPKPPEPKGLGAVVEDEAGSRWIRIWGNGIGRAWLGWVADDAADERQPYSQIAAVKVLSEGVTA